MKVKVSRLPCGALLWMWVSLKPDETADNTIALNIRYPKWTSPEQIKSTSKLASCFTIFSNRQCSLIMCQWKIQFCANLALNVYENKLDLWSRKSKSVWCGTLVVARTRCCLRCYVLCKARLIPCTKPMNLSPDDLFRAAIYAEDQIKTIEVWDLMLRLLFEADVSNWKESSRLLWRIHRMPTKAWHWASQPKTAALMVIGQAPGLKTQEAAFTGRTKVRRSFAGLAGVDEDTFVNSGYFAALPMDFYFFQDTGRFTAQS